MAKEHDHDDRDITRDYLRNLIARSKWDGRGMLVSQDAWRTYLAWALDQLDAKDAALARYAEVALKAKPPTKKSRAKHHNYGNRMPR